MPWGGTATSAGPYPHTYSSQAGCDSLVTINITINQTYSTSETHAICDGGSYPLPWVDQQLVPVHPPLFEAG
ncbi:MAG: hypothetical protein IPQ03_14140 [Bacteroidetes bacterium]|nr:hypothetical protein [Bacteroidota bacterium]